MRDIENIKKTVQYFMQIDFEPTISKDPFGDTEVFWKKDGFRLLVDIPKDVEYPVSFYGSKNGAKIKGTLKF